MRTNGLHRWVAVAALATLGSHAAIAADGDLDPTFGEDGIALTGVADGSGAVSACGPVVQPDGKILLCSTRLDNGSSGADMFVARFTADGQLDPTFSFDGKVTIDFDGGAGSDSRPASPCNPMDVSSLWGRRHRTVPLTARISRSRG